MSKKYVIIGGVAGGMSAATRLRRRDEHASITVLERGGHVSFANCGLPYQLGGVIEDRESLLLQTPESLGARFGIDVRVRAEAIAIDPNQRTVTARHVETGATTMLHYDALVLSPGAEAVIPDVPGAERALPLRSIEDLDAMQDMVGALAPGASAVVMGGGFIGVEVAENLSHRGLNVRVVERNPQLLKVLDPEMAIHVERRLRDNGIGVELRTSVTAIGDADVTLDDGRTLPADLVVAASGVRPASAIAAAAGVELDERGAIIVDERLRTSVPGIFAVGDAATTRDFVDGSDAVVALAQTANRHGRLVADVIAGDDATARPVYATAIIGAFGLQAAVTGWSAAKLRRAGRAFRVIRVHPADHAGYYPGASLLSLKILVDPVTDLILGAQAVGESGADKRIDVLATAMQCGLAASSLMDLELAYAPQFGSAKDPVNLLGYVADNVRTGQSAMVDWDGLDDLPDATIVDVREPSEFRAGAIPGSVNIPLNDLRRRAADIPEGTVVVVCQVGLRGHVAERILRQLGHADVRNLAGGYRTWVDGMESLTRQVTAAPV